MKGNKIGKAGCRPLLQEGGYKARDQWHLEADIGLKVKLYLGFFFLPCFYQHPVSQWICLKDVMFSQKDLEMSSFNVLVRYNRSM